MAPRSVGTRPPAATVKEPGTVRDPSTAVDPQKAADVMGHYGEVDPPAQVSEPPKADPLVGPNGLKFRLQHQSTGFDQTRPLSEAQQRYMGTHSDADMADCDEEFGSGINDVAKVKYNDGFKGVFKSEAGKNESRAALRHGVSEDDPRFGNREIGAMALDRAMGLGMVPHTEFSTHAGQLGTTQQFVKGTNMIELEEKDPEAYKKLQQDPGYQSQLSDLQAFDYVTGNLDRHDGNVMVERGENGEFKRIHAIDNGISFAPTPEIDKNESNARGLPEKYNREMVAKIEALSPDMMRKQLEGLLKPEEIDAAIERRNRLLEDVKAKGEDAYVDDWSAEVARRTAAAGGAQAAPQGPNGTAVDAPAQGPNGTAVEEPAAGPNGTAVEAPKTIQDLDQAVQPEPATAQDPDKTETNPNRTQVGNPLSTMVSAVRGLLAQPPKPGEASHDKTQKTSV